MSQLQRQLSILGDQDIRTVVIDPPWQERGGGKIKRGADRHYNLLPTNDIPRVIMGCEYWRRLCDTAHCYLWVTNNFLRNGLRVLDCIGFEYVTNRVWVKDRIGLGQYFRGQHEIVLFGRRGDTVLSDATISSVLEAPRGAHSEKPQKFYDQVEAASPGRYLDIFARETREGWLTWGDEVDG